ncbi:glycosyltransferase [Streptococcus ruminantium]|uniref:glycosyltransferase n=1 Tax=Streptococcus ruminantium TaxID=1917441 RepID=UPI001F46B7DC|nr:glycosyltransferase [Streptococcus ruminantium]BDD43008.1 glycosyltransferase family 28 [Streptococcus ruminantium]
MIFVTVGTHEQSFDRLIREVDRLKKEGYIQEEIFIQSGYSDYIPQFCDYRPFLSYADMEKYVGEAELVICHGGPATFMDCLVKNKKLIIVPRQRQFNEHVNNHQVDFLNKLESKFLSFSVVYDIEELLMRILSYDSMNIGKFKRNNHEFNSKLKRLLGEMYKE